MRVSDDFATLFNIRLHDASVTHAAYAYYLLLAATGPGYHSRCAAALNGTS
jgi:hypothetical protein